MQQEGFTPLSTEETNKLLEEAKSGDEGAKEKLLAGNFPLIKSIIKNYQNKGVDYDDLYQIGCVGFMKAIYNFDSKYEVKFSTYAVPMIAGEVKRFMRDDGSIKVSRAIKTLWLKIKAYLDEFDKLGIETPSIKQLAEKFEVSENDIVIAMDASKGLISLNAELDESSSNSKSIIDTIVTENQTEQIIDNILLKEAINKLDPREKKILLLRYFRGKTQSEVAVDLNVSQVQVSRIENKILEKLKRKLK